MGSRRTHDERLRLLREVGVPQHRLARLRSPIGLDLTNRGTGPPLSDPSGPIHRTKPPARLTGAAG
ncbi:XdhC Rossmann domain-containing protein [Streptomyces sp. cf386]|nr:XdhC Rossmann domain-containing protein [Streptomyces sp. cf386]